MRLNVSWAARSCSRASSAPVLATQPFAVHELGAGEVNGDSAAAESLDRLAVEGLGRLAVAQKRRRAGPNAERPVCAARACSFVELAQSVRCDLAGVASGARLDQLDERPAEEAEILVRACALRGGEGVLVAAKAVVQDGGRVVGQTDRSSLAPGCRVSEARLDGTQRCGLLAAPGEEHQRRIPERRVPGCLGDRISLLDQRRRGGELSGVHVHAGAVGQRDGKDGERAGVASEADRATGQLMPRLVIPQFGCEGFRCDGAGSPKPAQLVVTAAIPFGECVQRSPERRHGLLVWLGEALRQTVQEKVDRPRRPRSGRRGAGRLGRLHDAAATALAAGEDRGSERLQVGLTRRRGVERFEPLGGVQQQWRGVAAALSGERDLAPQSLQARALKLVERGKFGGREQRVRRFRRARLQLGLGRGERPRAPPRRDRESARPPAPGTRPRPRRRRDACARSAERSSSAATSSSRPAAAWARCHARRSGSASGSVASASARCTSLAVVQRRRPVDRRPHQRMPEPHAGAELDQPGGLRRRRPRRLRPRVARPRARAASSRRPARPPRSAAAAASRPAATRAAAGSSARSGPPAAARREARTRPPAPPASTRGAAPAAPAGCRASRRRSGRAPARPAAADHRGQQRTGVVVAEALDHQLRQPAELPSLGSRAANTIATDSANSRRATNASACADA